MEIRCKIKREGGSEVKIEDTTYVFNDQNNHVCEVDNTKHVKILLGIPEAYEPASIEEDEKPKPAKKTAKKKAANAADSDSGQQAE